jgi:hypothetical protein
MIEETMDYTTWITSKYVDSENVDVVEYENIDGKKWKIYGKCNACGLCEIDTTTHVNIRYNTHTQQKETYTRNFLWYDDAGAPTACFEKDYELRKDIPMTPDDVNSIDGCVLFGEWIKNGN